MPSVRVVDGTIRTGMEIAFGAHPEDVYVVDEVGYLQLGQRRAEMLEAGEVGYVIANLRSVSDTRAGDTILDANERAAELLPGYREVKSMVFAGIYPTDSEQYEGLRDALEKLKLNDASLQYEPESSTALGFGFRCGFLGPAAHGDRGRATGAGVRTRPDHHRADRGVPRLPGGWDDVAAGKPQQIARSDVHRSDRGAVREGADHGPGRLRRRAS